MDGQNNSESEYQTFIRAKHERLFNTPPEIIDAAIHRATGSTPIVKERIVKGEANEVHAATTKDGQEVIIRIAHGDRGEQRFRTERWAIEQCAAVGVPVPRVFNIETVEYNGQLYSLSVESKLPGISLDELIGSGLDQAVSENLLKQAGATLSKIHSVTTNGFGRLDQRGNGEFAAISGIISDPELDEQSLVESAQKLSFDPAIIQRALKMLNEYLAAVPELPARLIHNDFGPKHLLVDDNKISGVFDFEIAQGGDPVREFARWQFFYEHRYPLAPLKEGYQDQSIFNADFDHRFNIWKLHTGLTSLHYYTSEQNKAGIKLCQDRLTTDIKFFE